MQQLVKPRNVIGFDARRIEFPSWNKHRRDRYLLRPSIRSPRSTDAMVWPSVFDTGIGLGLGREERTRLGLDGFPLPGWIGPEKPLWESLIHLQNYVASLPLATDAYETIAITIESRKLHGDYHLVDPTSIDNKKMVLLGYDVSDRSLLSGLSNCAYDIADLKQLRYLWGPVINHYHLLSSIEQAEHFCSFTTSRVSEHAPFFVFGLWTVT